MIVVSIIVPCYNEERTIALLLESIYTQTFPRAQMEVVIADGMSTDRTRGGIEAFAAAHPDLAIHVVDNPARTIPSALNQAIAAAQGDYIVRLDAHSAPYPDYIERCIAGSEKGLGDNVGGVWEILPGGEGWMASGIAVAAAHPLGVGDARYRLSGQAGAVDTVPFGAYSRDLVDRVGGFDETLLTNEDYEFNARLRATGGIVWLDPAIRTRYYARPTLGALARQYWRYGFWKLRMLRRYPDTLRLRQALPPAFVLSLIVLASLAFFWTPARWILGVEMVSYGLALLAAGALASLRKRQLSLFISVPLAIATMHFFWGGAFLWSLLSLILFPSYRRAGAK